MSMFYKKYLTPNHLVIASVEGSIFGDIVSAHFTPFFAKRALARIESTQSDPGTGIKFSYQKNRCF